MLRSAIPVWSSFDYHKSFHTVKWFMLCYNSVKQQVRIVSTELISIPTISWQWVREGHHMWEPLIWPPLRNLEIRQPWVWGTSCEGMQSPLPRAAHSTASCRGDGPQHRVFQPLLSCCAQCFQINLPVRLISSRRELSLHLWLDSTAPRCKQIWSQGPPPSEIRWCLSSQFHDLHANITS